MKCSFRALSKYARSRGCVDGSLFFIMQPLYAMSYIIQAFLCFVRSGGAILFNTDNVRDFRLHPPIPFSPFRRAVIQRPNTEPAKLRRLCIIQLAITPTPINLFKILRLDCFFAPELTPFSFGGGDAFGLAL